MSDGANPSPNQMFFHLELVHELFEQFIWRRSTNLFVGDFGKLRNSKTVMACMFSVFEGQ